jgi:hypothetical protein
MKKLLPLTLMLLTVSAYGQSAEVATTTRAVNGKLISVTNIIGLSDCQTRSTVGKVKGVKVDGDVARFGLSANKETKDVEVRLDRIAADERVVLFKDLIRKGNVLRIAGYACDSGSVISAFSIDRVYQKK